MKPEEISQSIESIANITRQSATGIEQTVEACQGLSRLADDLNTMVARFKLSEDVVVAGTEGTDQSFETQEFEEEFQQAAN